MLSAPCTGRWLARTRLAVSSVRLLPFAALQRWRVPGSLSPAHGRSPPRRSSARDTVSGSAVSTERRSLRSDLAHDGRAARPNGIWKGPGPLQQALLASAGRRQSSSPPLFGFQCPRQCPWARSARAYSVATVASSTSSSVVLRSRPLLYAGTLPHTYIVLVPVPALVPQSARRELACISGHLSRARSGTGPA